MPYEKENIITERTGNNAFAWEERKKEYGKDPTLFVPRLIEGVISHVVIGDAIVFEEVEKKRINSCIGLRNFVRISRNKQTEIVIFDNHNHALYFWLDAVRK